MTLRCQKTEKQKAKQDVLFDRDSHCSKHKSKKDNFRTTSSSCRPRGAVTTYDTPRCSFAASAVKEGISWKKWKTHSKSISPDLQHVLQMTDQLLIEIKIVSKPVNLSEGCWDDKPIYLVPVSSREKEKWAHNNSACSFLNTRTKCILDGWFCQFLLEANAICRIRNCLQKA